MTLNSGRKMFLDFTVPVPVLRGKITRQKTKSGTYIHYGLDRIYNKQKQYNVPKRVLIGKLAPDGVNMIPNENFLTYFPTTPLPEVRANANRSSTLSAGTFMVVDKVSKDVGLKPLLEKHFQDKSGLVLDFITYQVVERRNQGQHYPAYAYRHLLFTKGMQVYSDSTVSRFLAGITDEDISGFLQDWNRKQDKHARIYISYDSTNKNSQAGDVDFVEYGKAKVDLGLPILNIGVAFNHTNQTPLFYEEYPGSINDVSQFQFFVDKVISYEYRNIGFILDRGYFSRANIEYMDENKYEFIIMVKGCKPIIEELIKQKKGTFEDSYRYAIRRQGISGITCERKLYPQDDKNRFFHLFFSPARYTGDRMQLDNKLEDMNKTFARCVGRVVDWSSDYKTYFDITCDKHGRFLYAREKADVIDSAYQACGYFCIISSEKMQADEAYKLYRGRDASEKLFSADKTFLGSKSMRVHSSESVSAKIFIEFLGLIVRQRIYNLLKDEMSKLPVKKNYMTVPAAVEELEKIELVRINGGNYQLDHAITKTQDDILRCFGLTKETVRQRAAELSEQIAKADASLADKATADEDDERDETEEMQYIEMGDPLDAEA